MKHRTLRVLVLSIATILAPALATWPCLAQGKSRKYTMGCLLALLLSISALAAPQAELRWTRVDADGFTVFSSTTDTRTLRVARNLNTFRGAIETAVTVCPAAESLPTVVFVVGSSRSFLRYWPTQQGAGGLFLSSDFSSSAYKH